MTITSDEIQDPDNLNTWAEAWLTFSHGNDTSIEIESVHIHLKTKGYAAHREGRKCHDQRNTMINIDHNEQDRQVITLTWENRFESAYELVYCNWDLQPPFDKDTEREQIHVSVWPSYVSIKWFSVFPDNEKLLDELIIPMDAILAIGINERE